MGLEDTGRCDTWALRLLRRLPLHCTQVSQGSPSRQAGRQVVPAGAAAGAREELCLSRDAEVGTVGSGEGPVLRGHSSSV